jgi:hypothetical protein
MLHFSTNFLKLRGTLIPQVNATSKIAIHNMNTGFHLTMNSQGDYNTTRQYMDREKVVQRRLIL